ncbi:MAG: DUF192 domain-containing protein [Alphaproteobacteria bacterium]|nr:MAG: DUF192 domain-containing protein [Alphaproteobacteria bacterium]
MAMILFLPNLVRSVTAVPATALNTSMPMPSLTVESPDGTRRHSLRVEIVRTDEEKARGLMFRTELAQDAGMLFTYDPPQSVVMWMKNTLIPLDMLFFDANGTIIYIEREAAPETLNPRGPSGGPAVRAVLEIKGGLAAKLGIQEGDRLTPESLANLAPIKP